MKSKAPGELVQIDHMVVKVDGVTLKHFTAVCPYSKFMAD